MGKIIRIIFFALPFLAAVWVRAETLIPLYVYAVVSVITFIIYGIDKAIAVKNNGHEGNTMRVPEYILHLCELLGGIPGALLGQVVLNHKSTKVSYQIVFWIIVGLHVAGWVYFLGFYNKTAETL